MNVVQCLSHSIEEYDMLRLYARIGVDAFSVGGYIDPSHPHDDARPALPDSPFHPGLKACVDALGQYDNLGAAQARLPDELLEWADVIVYHHHLERLFIQWPRIKAWLDGGSHRRVIWRSVGQSVTGNEQDAAPFMAQGLERVLYSPKERNIPGFSGGDSPLIRFGKDPADWYGWTGEDARVLNISQHAAEPHARDEWLNWAFWEEATRGLPRVFAGTHSEKIGGLGKLSYDDMRALLRACKVYLYTGTQPASYTLGLIEAMMTGIPVVSIGPSWMRIFPFGPALFEGHELVGMNGSTKVFPYDSPADARLALQLYVEHDGWAPTNSDIFRRRAIDLFGIDTIADQWAAHLGVKVAA
jgi:glycosyltransferase involved in cell wall biosynthesis